MFFTKNSFKSLSVRVLFVLGLALVSACTSPQIETGLNDPWEASNRRAHAFNKSVDKAFLRPGGNSVGRAIPDPLVTSVGNFADNLSSPGMVVNNLLQADAKGAFTNSVRFVVNTTIGVGGIFDIATMAGIYEVETDFGETLHVWGAAEGAYLELPLLGPSTERDTIGRVVDIFTNPLGYVLPKPEKYVGTAANVAKKLVDRGRYSQTVDSVLYDSADSYAQARSSYLQNRRYQLGGGGDALADPYDDPYGAGDPYDN